MFEKHKARRAAEAYQTAHTAWKATGAQLAARVEQAKTWAGDSAVPGAMLKPGEACFWSLDGAGLVENRHGQGHYVAGTAGVSIPTGIGRTRVRLGTVRGHFEPGAEADMVIDTGTALVTTARILFLGSKATREWAFSKLVGLSVHGLAPHVVYLELSVSNRQKVSGLAIPAVIVDELEFRLNLARAVAAGDRSEVIAHAQADVDAHATQEPIAPAAVAAR